MRNAPARDARFPVDAMLAVCSPQQVPIATSRYVDTATAHRARGGQGSRAGAGQYPTHGIMPSMPCGRKGSLITVDSGDGTLRYRCISTAFFLWAMEQNGNDHDFGFEISVQSATLLMREPWAFPSLMLLGTAMSR